MNRKQLAQWANDLKETLEVNMVSLIHHTNSAGLDKIEVYAEVTKPVPVQISRYYESKHFAQVMAGDESDDDKLLAVKQSLQDLKLVIKQQIELGLKQPYMGMQVEYGEWWD